MSKKALKGSLQSAENGFMTKKRKVAVCSLLEQGMSLSQVAKEVGLTRERVRQIGNQEERLEPCQVHPDGSLEGFFASLKKTDQ
jgi:DNA-directed RNA polymerase sigma subunit (sigma70/sigma32)